jgi:hypothetical protein
VRRAAPVSWRLVVDQPQTLLIALYVRDALALDPAMDALAWARERKREHAAWASVVEGEVVAEVERRLDRPAAPFRLRITELPLETVEGWPLTDAHALVTARLRRDARAYRAWLLPVVRALA